MQTRVLIIYRQLPVAVSLKQALERTGNFQVRPFTALDPALEFLRGNPQDVALLDVSFPGAAPKALVDRIRSVQPDIAILLTPQQPEELSRQLDLKGSINPPLNARDLIPLIQTAMEGRALQRKGRTGLLTRVLDTPAAPPPDQTKRGRNVPQEDVGAYTPLENLLPSVDALVGGVDTPRTEPEAETPRPRPKDTGALWRFEADPELEGSSDEGDSFDDVLSALQPDEEAPAEPRQTNIFEDLVKSMRGEQEERPPLPARHQQQMVEFTIPGTMDSLLEEIERVRRETDQLKPQVDAPNAEEAEASAERKEEEELLPSSFEDTGTIGDLMTGVHDPSFLNVLSILRGEEVPEEEPAPPTSTVSEDDLRAAFPSFYQESPQQQGMYYSGDLPEEALEELFSEVEQEPPAPPVSASSEQAFEFADLGDDEESTPARVILESALDESTPLDSFSISELIASIEQQLPAHKPKIKPLPSWLEESESAEAAAEDQAPASGEDFEEPDFLAGAVEALPSEEDASEDEVERLFAELEDGESFSGASESGFTGDLSDLTTRAGRGLHIEDAPEELDTEFMGGRGDDHLYAGLDDVFSIEAPIEEIPSEVDAAGESWGDLSDVQALLGNAPAEAAEQDEDTREIVQEAALQDELAALFEQPEVREEISLAETPEEALAEDIALERIEGEEEPTTTLFSGAADYTLRRESFGGGEYDLPQIEIEADVGMDTGTEVEAPPDYLPQLEREGEDAPEADETQYNINALHAPTVLRAAVDDAQANGAEEAEPPQTIPEPLPEAPAPRSRQPSIPLPKGFESEHIDDPYIAQLALSLTEVSLELTAEAALLTREGEIVAYAGRMASEEIEELRAAIKNDWDAKPDEARIRFINLQGKGDFMLYSRRTDANLTLTLIFAASTPLRDIRRQGKRLVDALRAVPEVKSREVVLPAVALDALDQADAIVSEAPAPPPSKAPALAPFAYVWILRDPNARLEGDLVPMIVEGLQNALRAQGWNARQIEAHDEYVYVLADVSTDRPPYDIIEQLKRRSAEIVHQHDPSVDPETLWADSYLVVTPGRVLAEDEIAQFITFERMMS